MRTARNTAVIHRPNLSRHTAPVASRDRYAPRLKKKVANTFGQRTGHTDENHKPNRRTMNGSANLLAERKWITGATTTSAIRSRMNQNWIAIGYSTVIPNKALQ